MDLNESVVNFSVRGERLFGIYHPPQQEPSTRGVLIVVGGPQYRVGSHRQFVLLARFLAANGIPVLRFDYRGMGDSEGDIRTFESIDEDIHASIDCLFDKAPNLEEAVIWGLCDAASAAAFYAKSDPRVSGLVLLNPWVRTEAGIAKAYLKHYYLSRLFGREFWRKVVSGRFDFSSSTRSLWKMVSSVLGKGQDPAVAEGSGLGSREALPERMCQGLRAFPGRLLFVLSGDDLTADEFRDAVKRSRQWRKLLRRPHVCLRDLGPANHTFSRREWRDTVAAWTLDWLRSW